MSRSSSPRGAPSARRSNWLGIVRPRVVICLGATAGRSALGRSVKVTQERGRPLDVDALYEVVLTTHPSALLRLRDRGDYTGELRRLADDLRTAVAL